MRKARAAVATVSKLCGKYMLFAWRSVHGVRKLLLSAQVGISQARDEAGRISSAAPPLLQRLVDAHAFRALSVGDSLAIRLTTYLRVKEYALHGNHALYRAR